MKELRYCGDERFDRLNLIEELLQLEDGEEFRIINESVIPISEDRQAEYSKAVAFALKDLRNKESALYRNVFVPFSAHHGVESECIKTFLLKLVNSIWTLRAEKLNTVELDAYVATGGLYFRFEVPEHCLKEAFREEEVYMLEEIPRPGFRLLELGPYALVNYVLGYYYEFLARWCSAPDDPIIRDFENWDIGPH